MSNPAQEQIHQWVTQNRVVLLMKGTPNAPLCGFSATAAQLLNQNGISDYFSFDVLSDQEIRQAAKDYAGWPTFPQLYVGGELIGGCDIMREMAATGELSALLSGKK
ncbi:MAG: Grx4 family monothiol glutaredoxin [Burkholderiales bacterium]|nr:Grx4 family monothiol glutaredoxin [Burkholderiales bacterium]